MNPQIHADNVKLMQDWPINRGIVETFIDCRYGHVVGYKTPYRGAKLLLVVKFSDRDETECIEPRSCGSLSYMAI